MDSPILILDHWIDGAEQIASPNCDGRPNEDEISLVVIHCISLPPGQFGGSDVHRFFTNRLDPDAHPYFRTICLLKVSAHVLIRRNGELIQYVPFNKRAWHAGVSCYDGRTQCNDYSIGIELEGTDNSSFASLQYERLATIINALLQRYPQLSPERVTGHSDIAPGRKLDPGKFFDWKRLRGMLARAAAPK